MAPCRGVGLPPLPWSPCSPAASTSASAGRGLGPRERAILDEALSCSFVGTAAEVREGLAAFAARTGADELMVVSQVFDHAARRRSYERVAPGPAVSG